MRYLGRAVDDMSILLLPPNKQVASGEFLLGNVIYAGKPSSDVFLRRENLLKHIGIFSITGGGKSNIGLNLMLSLLKAEIPFLVLDWKRSYRVLNDLRQKNDTEVVVYSVGRDNGNSLKWNPLRPPPHVHVQTWLSVVAESLEKSHISGQGVADVFIDLFDTLFEKMGHYEGKGTEFPNFFDARAELQRKSHTRGRRALWQDSCARILRTFVFGPAAKAFNARKPIELEKLLERPVIFELDQELPKPLRVFFSEIILRWLHLYRLGQGEHGQLRHVLLLEEVHNLFPRSSIERQTTNSLENIVREIRSFGQGLIFITQHPSQLPVYILGNCNTQIYLALQHDEDIQTARQALFLPISEAHYLDRLKVGEGIVKIKGRIDPCFVQFPHVLDGRGKAEA